MAECLTMDLHADQIQGFFDVPVDNLYARPVLVKALREMHMHEPIIVSPDVGSNKMARRFADDLKVDLAIVDKRRLSATRVEASAIIGDVKGKEVILVDDICSTGETLRLASLACKKAGAKKVIAAITHGLLLEDVFAESGIEILFTTNTVAPIDKKYSVEVRHLSVAPLFAQAAERVISSQSVSSLFG